MSATATLQSPTLRSGVLSRLGDEALARRAAAGNDAAFTALYERYHGPLLGYCRSILLNDEDAQDATQNALENALRSLPRREPGRPLRPWLYRIAHNEAINVVRRRRPQAELTELDEPTVPGPEVDSEHRGRLAQLVDDLRALPERQRGALVMRELSGLSYDDIAIALGVSREAARRAVFDARSALHEAVDGRATECVSVRHCISDGDRRSLRARRIRAHLRSCNDCATFELAIHARRADLHLLGPLLSGPAIAGMLGGGAGGGALLVAGGGGATVTVASWSSMPVVLKGLTVAAVVATTGGAAVELKHVAKPEAPVPKTQAARRPAAAASPTAHALQAKLAPAAKSAARHARAAPARFARATLRSPAASGAFVASRGEKVATPAQPVAATAPAPALAPTPVAVQPQPQQRRPQQQAASEPAPARPAKTDPAKTAIAQLTDIREQVAAAIERAQSIAAGGSALALQSADDMLQGTLGAMRPAIERILARAGLRLPEAAATVAPPPTTTPASLPNVMAPVQQMLDGVDSMLSKLFGRRAR